MICLYTHFVFVCTIAIVCTRERKGGREGGRREGRRKERERERGGGGGGGGGGGDCVCAPLTHSGVETFAAIFGADKNLPG